MKYLTMVAFMFKQRNFFVLNSYEINRYQAALLTDIMCLKNKNLSRQSSTGKTKNFSGKGRFLEIRVLR